MNKRRLKMKESQSGMARNWEDEGELFDDPLDDEE